MEKPDKKIVSATRKQWLKERSSGIGGSDAAAVIGCNPWLSNQELYKIKTGETEPEDNSNAFTEYGTRAEPFLRELFKLDYPQYEVLHEEFKVHRHKEYPFMLGTFDGTLTDKATGSKGILEIKTTQIMSAQDWKKWNEQVPQNYFIQLLHYLLVSGFQYAVLVAQIKSERDGEVKKEIRHYKFDRSSYERDIEYLKEREKDFWENYVVKRVLPPLILPGI